MSKGPHWVAFVIVNGSTLGNLVCINGFIYMPVGVIVPTTVLAKKTLNFANISATEDTHIRAHKNQKRVTLICQNFTHISMPLACIFSIISATEVQIFMKF